MGTVFIESFFALLELANVPYIYHISKTKIQWAMGMTVTTAESGWKPS